MTDIVERLRGGYKFGDSDTVLEAADRIAELEQQIYSERKSHEGWQQQSLIDEAELGRELAAETKNKQDFERDWLACCDKLNDERRIHLELEEILVKKLEAAQAREKVLRDALDNVLLNATAYFPEPMLEMVEDALAQPTDDTALRAALESERIKTAVVFDGYAVMQQLDARQKARTSQENVTDVLDAVARLMCSNASLTGAEPACVASELKR